MMAEVSVTVVEKTQILTTSQLYSPIACPASAPVFKSDIFPREIEEFLYQHPKIDEVEVFGVPDPKFGEEICAWIKLKQGEQANEEEIREFCREKIAHFKIPRYIKFVSDFPMTVTGKVQKYKMRERMAEELGVASKKAS